MPVTRAEKATEIDQLSEAFRGTRTAIVVDYRGLNVPQVTELRRQIHAVRSEYRVVKNTLAKRALKGTAFEDLGRHFQGTTAIAYTGDDPVALAKALTAFARTAPSLQIKGAVVQGRALAAAEVSDLATLPGRPELGARLLFLLQATMVRLVRVLNAAPRDLMSVLVQAENSRKPQASSRQE